MVQDRGNIYGREFQWRVSRMRIEQVCTAPPLPWQNPYVERIKRIIGSVRREYLDHLIIVIESHLRGILRTYFAYYHDF